MNHHADIERSKRLQRVLRVLNKRKWSSTQQISREGRTEAAGSTISELRSNGYDIECKYFGANLDGGRVYKYRLHA